MASSDLVVSTRTEENVEAILHSNGLKKSDLKCSICHEDLSDLKHLGAIFPYGSAIISCDRFECLCAVRDLLIAK